MGWWEDLKKETEKVVSDIGNAGQKAWEDIDGTTAYEAADKKGDKQRAQDGVEKENFKKFKEQDLLNTDQELYMPSYIRNNKLQKEQEAMLSLFNARKDEVLAARRTPGINQTRF